MAQTTELHPREHHVIRMLAAENAQGDLLLLREALHRRAPQVSIHTVPDGVALLRRLAAEETMPPATQSQVLVLDANLPRLDVRALVISLRALTSVPRVVVLAFDEGQADRFACLGSLEARVEVRPVYYGQWLALVESLMPMLETRLPASEIRPPAPLPRSDGVRR